jgi:hypothetical protein
MGLSESVTPAKSLRESSIAQTTDILLMELSKLFETLSISKGDVIALVGGFFFSRFLLISGFQEVVKLLVSPHSFLFLYLSLYHS